MNKLLARLLSLSALSLVLLCVCGCSAIGDKTAAISSVYALAALAALALLVSYCCFMKRRDPWFLLMFSAILIVNVGYFALSTSQTLPEALLANRIAYFGSVFLPLSMLVIILKAVNFDPPRWVPVCLLGLGVVVFLIAASPGYSDIYYKEVSLGFVNGATVLEKVYGPWHGVYLVYLVGYFSAMVAAIVCATIKRKIASSTYAVMLAAAVLVNIAVWLLEQCVSINFEILSISYLISELFLLGLQAMTEKAPSEEEFTANGPSERPEAFVSLAGEAADDCARNALCDGRDALLCDERNAPLSDGQNATLCDGRNVPSSDLPSREAFLDDLERLTKTERAVLDLYLQGYGTKDVMSALDIKENTLKYHNRNLYAKMGVSSRKQLLAAAKAALSKA